MKKAIFFVSLLFLLFPTVSLAEVNPLNSGETQFEAKIVDVSESFIRVEDENRQRFSVEQMDLLGAKNQFHAGDKVLVNKIVMEDGSEQYIITDVVRKKTIYFIIALFIVIVLLLYRRQGLRALLSLMLSLLVIIFFIAPLILQGKNSLLVTIFGSTIILLLMMYITHGFKKKTHSAFIGIFISVIIGGILSYLFVSWASLSGFVQDEATFIISLGYTDVDMRGLLLSAIIIGMLGVLDDMAINQASIVKELHEVDKNLDRKTIYKKAMRVGRDHVGSMINTLLFAYIGASFPLFLMFVIKQPPFDTLGGVLNNEIVATEVIRTLVGSIALLLSVPITTWVAVRIILSHQRQGSRPGTEKKK